MGTYRELQVPSHCKWNHCFVEVSATVLYLMTVAGLMHAKGLLPGQACKKSPLTLQSLVCLQSSAASFPSLRKNGHEYSHSSAAIFPKLYGVPCWSLYGIKSILKAGFAEVIPDGAVRGSSAETDNSLWDICGIFEPWSPAGSVGKASGCYAVDIYGCRKTARTSVVAHTLYLASPSLLADGGFVPCLIWTAPMQACVLPTESGSMLRPGYLALKYCFEAGAICKWMRCW